LIFSLVLWHELADEINRLPGKIRRTIKPALKRLEEDPFLGSKGDKEKLVLKGGVFIYQLHISQRYSVFYEIDKEEKRVIVQEILTIEQAHKKYG
jgi:mRNA interferase RelE/StbE